MRKIDESIYLSEIKQMWCYENNTILDITDALPVGQSIVRRCIKKYNLDRCYKDKNWLHRKHYIERKNTVEMAAEAKCSFWTIRDWMKKHKLEICTEIANDRKRKYTFNHDYFKEVDTEEKAYWLGFLVADGSMSSSTSAVTLSQSTKDKHHLQKFLDAIESDYVIEDYINNSNLTKQKHEMSRVVISSRRFHNHLIDKGMKPLKSNNEEKPNIKEEYYKHFIRGYFDGDGTISCGIRKRTHNWKTQTTYTEKIWAGGSILGGEDFLEGLSKVVFKNTGHKLKVSRKSKNENVSIISFADGTLKDIMNWLYENSTVYLDRKKEKFEEYLYLLKNKEKYELKDIVRTPIEKRRVEQK